MTPTIPLPDQFTETLIPSACSLLRRLGVTENYKGFHYAAYAAALCALEQDRLLLVTRLIYPDVARRFETTWQTVEHNLRTAISIAWETNSAYLASLAQQPLPQQPSCACFLAILSRHLRLPSAGPIDQ